MMSPSCTTYSLPSRRSSPWSRQRLHGAARDERVVADHLGADEPARDVAVDLAGGVERDRAAADRPGPAFVFADREERHVAEQVVAGADHAIEPRFREPEILQERLGVGRFERGDLELDLRAHRHGPRAFAREERGHPGLLGGALDAGGRFDVGLVHVEHDEQRLGRQQLEAAQPPQVVAREAERSQRLPVLERGAAPHQQILFLVQVRRLVLLEVLLHALEPAFDDAEVGEDQLVFHRLGIARRVDRAGRMRDGFIAKRADHVHERVGVLVTGDVDQRGGPGAPGRDHVGEFDRRGHALLRIEHRREAIEPRIGHLRDADDRFGLPPRRVLRARHQLEQAWTCR